MVLRRLDLEPWDVARLGEQAAKDSDLKAWPRERRMAALVEHPILIQRPIITADDGTAVVGRPEDAVRPVLPA